MFYHILSAIRTLKSYCSSLILIILTFKNWHEYLFYSFISNSKDKTKMMILRNSLKFFYLTSKSVGGAIAEIWLLNCYTKNGINIENGDIVVDIGANIGAFSIFAATKFENTKVYSYEPMPNTFKLLEKNIKINNLKNIKPYNIAISGKAGHKTFFIEDNDNCSCTIIDEEINKINPKYQILKCITLKDVFQKNNIERIDFLKMDCEGSEYDILFNTPKKYIKKVKKISLEFHHSKSITYNCLDLKKFLEKNGFNVTIKGGVINNRNGIIYAKRY